MFLTTSLVLADNVQEKKSQLNETKKNIENLKEKINDVKEKQENVEKEINNLNNKIESIQKNIQKVNQEIYITKKNIKTLNKEIQELQKQYEEQVDLFNQRIKVLYMNGPSSFIEVLFDSVNFSDFFARMDNIMAVMESDKQLLKEISDKKQNIKIKIEEVTRTEANLISMQKSYEEQKKELDDISKEQRKLYSKLENDKEYLEKTLKQEEAESKALEQQIQQLQAKQSSNSTPSRGNGATSKTGILKLSDIGYMPPITSPFGMRYHPVLGYSAMHYGLDIAVPSGTPIYAMADGQVIISDFVGSYGNLVVIDHGNGVTSLYAHLSSRQVSVGQAVNKGQLVAISGNTGRSTGPHLHFEVRINGTPVDPAPYYIVGQ